MTGVVEGGPVVTAAGHELLVRLAGRLPDDVLWRLRDWLGADALGLGFIPLAAEHYDFAVHESARNRATIAAFEEALSRSRQSLRYGQRYTGHPQVRQWGHRGIAPGCQA